MRIGILLLVLWGGLGFFPASAESLRDVKPPVEVPGSPWPAVVGGMVVLLLGVWWWVEGRRRWGTRRAAPPSSRTPSEIALESLQTLQQNRDRGLTPKGYYEELSTIVRTYLEARFQLRAPEMTTDEFLRSLNQTEVLTAGQKEFLKDFLNACDLVKFAKFSPPPQEAESAWNKARQLVMETSG